MTWHVWGRFNRLEYESRDRRTITYLTITAQLRVLLNPRVLHDSDEFLGNADSVRMNQNRSGETLFC